MKLQILGKGCAKCVALGEHAEAAAKALGLEYELEKVTDLNAIIDAGVMTTPALALLLAGPALSLPNMLVIRGILGTQKTLVYCALVVVMATLSGVLFGTFYP